MKIEPPPPSLRRGKQFFAELKRRNVYKVAVVYAVTAWLLIQAASVLLPTFEAPAWVMKVIVMTVVLGFPIAVILAWAFEITPEGVKRTEDVPQGQSIARSTGRKLDFAIIGVLVLAVALLLFDRFRPNRPPPEAASAQKSIAVLPFENLSRDPDNSFFTEGVQDQILTNLAQIADLKVISRTSVMHYKTGAQRNLREIREQLGVAHVVEGSVQRANNRVRVNAQLIDARNDWHLWAQTYDRDLADVFAIQSEIAKAIADQLQAKLSPREQRAIERRPTSDLVAFDLYTRAKNHFVQAGFTRAELLEIIDLLNQAVARDSSFFDAYHELAFANGNLYLNFEHTPGRLALAERAVQSAARLRPNAGETHLARARILYWGYLDYQRAWAELELARQTLPNHPQLFELTGSIQRRQGHWEEAAQSFERANELDPRNEAMYDQTAITYHGLRRYAQQKAVLTRSLELFPNDVEWQLMRAAVDLDWKADTRALRQMLEVLKATDPKTASTIGSFRLLCALAEHDGAAAMDALSALSENEVNPGFADNVVVSRSFMEGVIARMTNDADKAREAFTAARLEQEKVVQTQPDYGPAWSVLGLIDAGLGRKEEALREGRRAVELLPAARDAITGTAMIKYLAMIAAWVGDKELACENLALVTSRPSDLSYGQLKLLPYWDPLRGDSCFEQIVASLAPKDGADGR